MVLAAPKHEPNQATIRGVLYPLWDAGWQVGHALRTPKGTVEQARADLDAATAILVVRLVAGDPDVFAEFLDRRARWLRKDARVVCRRILEARTERHARVSRAGWSLAPDLKDDVGGLRDLHTIEWLRVIGGFSPPADDGLVRAGDVLLAVREGLHAEIKRKNDRVHIDLQPKIAGRLGLEGGEGADELMARVHTAARTIEHVGSVHTGDLAERMLGGPRRSGSYRSVAPGIRLADGALDLDPTAGVDAATALTLLTAHATGGHPIARKTLDRMREIFDGTPPEPWPDQVRLAFVGMLRGPRAATALELVDHLGGWDFLMPEWLRIRGRAQHDPYHRYTVDGHSFLAVQSIADARARDQVAQRAYDELEDDTALLVGTLLHDVGKESGRDHSVTGEGIAREAATRMGLDPQVVEDIASLVRHHLLLPDTATRRDIDDGAVIEAVAAAVGTADRLRMLYVLAAADGSSTGPEAWTTWKQMLVAELFRKTLIALETGKLPTRSDVTARAAEIEAFEPALAGRAVAVLDTLPHSYLSTASVPDMVDEIKLLLQPPRPGEVRYRVDEGTEGGQSVVTVCVVDRPGTLARSAGVFALNRLPVVRAQAFSTSNGLALERFVVAPLDQPGEDHRKFWDAFMADLDAAYSGRLALEARLETKVRHYRDEAGTEPPEVSVLQDASPHSTLVEVRAPDVLGLLYTVTAGLSDLDLDIHVAKIDTKGSRVVDVFYVRTLLGEKLSDEQAAEVQRAIAHRWERMFAR